MLEVFAGIISSFLPDYWSFTIVRMVLGFSIGGIMVVGFVIVMEYVGNTIRDIVAALFHIPFTMGHMTLALIGYFIREYMYLQLVISVSNVILLLYICLLPESPRWLLAANKTFKAISLMETIAKRCVHIFLTGYPKDGSLILYLLFFVFPEIIYLQAKYGTK